MGFLSIVAVLFVVLALCGEVYGKDVNGKTNAGRAYRWIKAHSLNVAVALDILVAEHKDFFDSLKEYGFVTAVNHIPGWVWFVASLIVLSFAARSARQRRVARLAAAALTVAETVV